MATVEPKHESRQYSDTPQNSMEIFGYSINVSVIALYTYYGSSQVLPQ